MLSPLRNPACRECMVSTRCWSRRSRKTSVGRVLCNRAVYTCASSQDHRRGPGFAGFGSGGFVPLTASCPCPWLEATAPGTICAPFYLYQGNDRIQQPHKTDALARNSPHSVGAVGLPGVREKCRNRQSAQHLRGSVTGQPDRFREGYQPVVLAMRDQDRNLEVPQRRSGFKQRFRAE